MRLSARSVAVLEEGEIFARPCLMEATSCSECLPHGRREGTCDEIPPIAEWAVGTLPIVSRARGEDHCADCERWRFVLWVASVCSVRRWRGARGAGDMSKSSGRQWGRMQMSPVACVLIACVTICWVVSRRGSRTTGSAASGWCSVCLVRSGKWILSVLFLLKPASLSAGS